MRWVDDLLASNSDGTVAVGSDFGRRRSVALVEIIADRLVARGLVLFHPVSNFKWKAIRLPEEERTW